MTFAIREKIIGYRTILVNADSPEEAETKWFTGDIDYMYQIDPSERELVRIEEEE